MEMVVDNPTVPTVHHYPDQTPTARPAHQSEVDRS